jgi:hypothetical protein
MEFKFVVSGSRSQMPRGLRSVCDRTLPRISGSNFAGSMDFCLLLVLCVVRVRSLRRAGPSSRGSLPNVCVCHWVWSSTTITLCTYNKQVEVDRLRKKDLFGFMASGYLMKFWTCKKHIKTWARILNFADFPFKQDFRRVKSMYRQCLIWFRDNCELITGLDNYCFLLWIKK